MVTGSISLSRITGSISLDGRRINAPSLLVATTVAFNRIDLTWQDNSVQETGFSIERSLDGITYAQIATVAAEVEAYSDTTCLELTEYFYRVRAFRNSAYSGYSNVDSATTIAE